MLSRPFYRFCRFDLKSVPKPQRVQALELQIRQWTPFANTGRYLVWQGEDALIWAWDADRLGADIATQNLSSNRVEILPESLLHPPLADGLRLAACLDGVEGQLWQDGFLVHSRWWPAVPTEAEWLNFQRDAGNSAQQQSTVVPPPARQNWLLQPWARNVPAGSGGAWTASYETWLVGAGVLILAGMTSWYGIQLAKTRQALELRNSELKAAETIARPIFEARQRALDAQVRIELLQKAGLYPDQLAVMATLATLLPRNTATLTEWDYRDDKLKISVSSPSKLSSSVLIGALLDSGWFGDVRAAPTSDPTLLTLTMEVKPWNQIREKPADESDQKAKELPVPAKTTRKDAPRP